MKHWILVTALAVLVVPSVLALEAVSELVPEEDCLGLIAILPTFRNKDMSLYYQMTPNATGKQLAARIQLLADGGDKDLQFTYSQLLLNGYCVPKDVCAARRYLEKSRGGPNDWEKVYPVTPFPKDAESKCH